MALSAMLLGLCPTPWSARVFSQQKSSAVIEGTVLAVTGKPVPGVWVVAERSGESKSLKAETDAEGKFTFPCLPTGSYLVRVEYPGFRSPAQLITLGVNQRDRLKFVLEPSHTVELQSNPSQPVLGPMQLEDKPDFTVAGITDWTAAGGHGSDANLRASEALARETRGLEAEDSGKEHSASVALKESEEKLRTALARFPGSFDANHQMGEFYLRSHQDHEAIPFLEAAYQLDPENYANAYDLALAYERSGELLPARQQIRKMLESHDRAELHRLLGDLDEQSKDPLAAVREYQRAVQMQPSEPNYFAWAEELLIHRAVEPAIEVFTQGARAYPGSERMLAGLGAALYAGGSYDEAAQQLCGASDLKPSDPMPYLFLGKMDHAAPRPLACVEGKLARFVRDHPTNPAGNYYYALALRKRARSSDQGGGSQQVESLLRKVFVSDPKFAAAYLQLGIVYSELGEFAKAVPLYQKALAADPSMAEAHFRLGQAYERMGERVKAGQQLDAYQRLKTTQATAVEQQRREIQQFVVVLKGKPANSTPGDH